MSDQNQTFGGPSTAVVEPDLDEVAESKGPKPMLIVGVVLALVVAAAAGYFLLFSGSGGSTDQGSAVVPAPHTSTAPSAAKPSAAPSAVPSAAGISGTGRDPYQLPASVAAAQAAASASANPTTSAAASTSAAPVSGSVPAGTKVSLGVVKVDSKARNVTVTVNGKTYAGVVPGQVFGTYFQLVGFVDTGCASFNFGDTMQVPKLCVGQTTVLQT
jgi:hypothetical protein